MHKKLLAAAVAGAFIAPATVLAQTSTVNIYGNITYEYGWVEQGSFRPDTDYADTPGGSAIGFRGEEKLGGNLSAWFQCESSADVRGMDHAGWCTRNSAVGLKGGFGNLFFGKWDTPFKRAMNIGSTGAQRETGITGTSFIGFGGSGGADATATGDGPQRQRWKRREAGQTYYETPSFGGFRAMGAFTTGNWAADTAVDERVTPFNHKPRVWSVAATYTGGPFGVGVGYEKHADFGAHQGASPPGFQGADLDDRGWGISASYTFAGRIEVGAAYLDRQWETAPGREVKKKTWQVGVEWAIAGPHTLMAQYLDAGDSKGNSLVAIGGNGGANAPRVIVGGIETAIGDTGAKAIHLAYRYAFSKRTHVGLAWMRLDNDSNGTAVRLGNTAPLLVGGEKVDAFAAVIGHRF